MSRIRLLDYSKLAINLKNDNDFTMFWHDSILNFFFWCCFVSLFKYSHWSKFHVNIINIITGSGVMTIFFYKGLTRNPEIENTPVWVLPNMWRMGWIRDTKFGMSLMKCYWKLQNARVTASTIFESRQTQQDGKTSPPPPDTHKQLSVIYMCYSTIA